MNGKQSQLREGGVWGVSFICMCLVYIYETYLFLCDFRYICI